MTNLLILLSNAHTSILVTFVGFILTDFDGVLLLSLLRFVFFFFFLGGASSCSLMGLLRYSNELLSFFLCSSSFCNRCSLSCFSSTSTAKSLWSYGLKAIAILWEIDDL